MGIVTYSVAKNYAMGICAAIRKMAAYDLIARMM